jgi:hypothetical protein
MKMCCVTELWVSVLWIPGIPYQDVSTAKGRESRGEENGQH